MVLQGAVPEVLGLFQRGAAVLLLDGVDDHAGQVVLVDPVTEVLEEPVADRLRCLVVELDHGSPPFLYFAGEQDEDDE